MRKVNVISVCGSGTVTSSMVAGKVKDFLEENGFKAQTVEVNPNGVDGQLELGSWDVIVHTSPLKKKYQVPTINSVGLLTGMGEEEFFAELLETVKTLDLG
ncbi:PTS sugar transporter subunit IIB [Vagococcus sp. BWB3-3]|uniref:PTS sugar transporter subunit IIB n=1 Tax=Vagococcus allomyrinae TaxID=2794353 RepID=A0A940PCY2_9ENTE|nr:PTS sugar transporter subunit IIB [Vagococcus allomyrinae]MBP1043786.1 PTS sugar transporter subunit IIB [Vagococcus allomyrinae]